MVSTFVGAIEVTGDDDYQLAVGAITDGWWRDVSRYVTATGDERLRFVR